MDSADQDATLTKKFKGVKDESDVWKEERGMMETFL